MRTEYREGEILTKDDIGLVFKSGDGVEWRVMAILDMSKKGVFAINSQNNCYVEFERNGKYLIYGDPNHTKCNLVAFVGLNFTNK